MDMGTSLHTSFTFFNFGDANRVGMTGLDALSHFAIAFQANQNRRDINSERKLVVSTIESLSGDIWPDDATLSDIKS
jgi:hypothetical protein